MRGDRTRTDDSDRRSHSASPSCSGTLLQISEDEIRDYINNDDLCNDEEGMFPKRSMLSGEWYIRSVSFEDDILSIETALLGTDLGYPDDYLGLELIFIYDDESKEFDFDGINSSAL